MYAKLRILAVATLVVFSAAFFIGCESDAESVTVNFSKRVDIPPPETIAPEKAPLRVAVAAMVSPKETFIYYREIIDYLSTRLEQNIELVQRKTYTEINEMLGQGVIDLAFICSGPYVSGKAAFGFEALAAPQIRGKAVYRSFLIVHRDSPCRRLDDLRGKTFAFTDPASNTGFLVPLYLLAEKREQPESFFGKTIFTYSHDNSILAVAKNLVDGAFVHEQIWEYYRIRYPEHASKTRIVYRSEPFGNPPLVASGGLADPVKKRVRDLVLSMHLDTEGKKVLSELYIDRFIPVNDELYDPVRKMKARLQEGKSANDATAKP